MPEPGKWRFPEYALAADGYLLVFASQKNKTNLPPRACRTRSPSLAGFHTNFRLDPDGEYLALVAPDTLTPVDSVTGETLLALAARVGDTRLIDNIVLIPIPDAAATR